MPGFSRLYKNGFTALALSAASSLANAGGGMSFAYSIFAPAPPPPPVVSATPVPTTSDALLMVLALLLIVIAVRALQSAGGIQKVLSLAVLGGGLILGGVSVDNTVADVPLAIPGEGMPCEGGETFNYFPFHGGNSTVTNNCEGDLTIDSVTTDECAPGDVVIPSATIEAGTAVSAPYCPNLQQVD